MCGIVGVVERSPVNQLIYDALLLLQHRARMPPASSRMQDRKFFMHKAGMVRDVPHAQHARPAGQHAASAGALPHGGNATARRRRSRSTERAVRHRAGAQRQPHQRHRRSAGAVQHDDHRHINTESDSEVLLNVLAHELEATRAACR